MAKKSKRKKPVATWVALGFNLSYGELVIGGISTTSFVAERRARHNFPATYAVKCFNLMPQGPEKFKAAITKWLAEMHFPDEAIVEAIYDLGSDLEEMFEN